MNEGASWSTKDINEDFTYQVYVPTGAVWNPVMKSTLLPKIYFNRYRSGVSTPNFRLLKRKGSLPMTSFTWSSETTRYWHGTYFSKSTAYYAGKPNLITYRSIRGVHSYMTGSIPHLVATSAEKSTAARVAITKSLLKLKDQKINIAQFWGERRQTVGLIAETAMKLASAFKSLKHGDIISAGKALGARPSRRIRRNFRTLHVQQPHQAAADAWLAMQYGWLPLLSDISGACEALAERESDIERFEVKSSHAITGRDYLTTPMGPGLGLPGGAIRKWKVTYRYTYTFTTLQSTGGMANAKTLTSLGLFNPLALGWELLPYSFVVDWFLPIGDYLSTLDAQLGVQFSTGCSVVVEESEVLGGWSNPQQYVDNERWGDLIYSSKKKSIVRTKLSSFPLPQFPAFKNPVSVTHAANAIALLSSVFGGKR